MCSFFQAGKVPLHYSIEPRSDPRGLFEVDPQTAVVRNKKTLDREVTASHKLIILAMDNGNLIRTATATFEVGCSENL